MAAYQKLRDKFESYRLKKGFDIMTKEALKWYFYNTAKFVKTATYSKTTDLGTISTHPIPGKIYLYKYDPKTKEKLPYYDTLPLVLITQVTSNGWYGINFHYMPPKVRLKIMEGFYDTLNTKKISEKTKLRINWKRAVRISKVVSADNFLKHSIKRYLANHTRTSLVEIDPRYWALCLFLPLSRFKKSTTKYIWKDV